MKLKQPMSMLKLILSIPIFLLAFSVSASKADAAVCNMFNGWSVYYFNNKDLENGIVTYDCISTPTQRLTLDWGTGAPRTDLNPDAFSAMFIRMLQIPSAGKYKIYAKADDGVRIRVPWVTNNYVIDSWNTDEVGNLLSSKVLDFPKGGLPIIIEYYENGGRANIEVWFEESIETNFEPLAPANAWAVEYYNSKTLADNKPAEYIPYMVPATPAGDLRMNQWGNCKKPLGKCGFDGFGSRFTQMRNFTAGYYEFRTIADDGVRIKLEQFDPVTFKVTNSKTIIDAWHANNSFEFSSKPVYLSGNYYIVVEHYDNGGTARIEVWWGQTSQTTPDYSTYVKSGTWLAEYYNNRSLNGMPVNHFQILSGDAYEGNGVILNKDWGAKGPADTGIDYFSARYTTKYSSAAGYRQILFKADDEARIYINGELIEEPRTNLGGGLYSYYHFFKRGDIVSVEYGENQGYANLYIEIK